MMYGKLYRSLYTGSMIGAGAVVFALMPYVIANAVPDKAVGGYVELNPILLATIFGVSAKEVEDGIEFLCSPDPKTSTPGEDGRRLIRLGPFAYRVVNYAKYKALRDEEDRREQNRLAQERWRAKHAEKIAKKAKGIGKKASSTSGGPLPGEMAYEAAVRECRDEDARQIAENQPVREGVVEQEQLKALTQMEGET